jgi:flagellar basal-body rod modification protein FlgD
MITVTNETPGDWLTNTNGAGATTSAGQTQDQLTSKDTFLKLLVAQMKNQDPLSPSDPTQFVGQLTQYSELEQLMQINSGVEKLATPATPTTGSSGDTGTSSSSSQAKF